MSKTVKTFKALILSVIILSTASSNANAFFLIPPMPWDIEINIPGNANKVVSNIKSLYRQLQAIKTGEHTEILKSVKIGNIDLNNIINKNISSKLPKSEKKGENKTTGKGKFKGGAELHLGENSVNEEEYYNAYYQLFFLLPDKEGYENFNIVESAFAEKRLDYQQDVIIDTYLYGRMNEDFLVLINKTVDRLDRCRIGELKDSDCIFFGMQYVYSDPTKEAPQGTEDEDAGSLGEQMNAYIVATMYDRMLRIIEDMTAMEAIYRAAKQIDLVEPIEKISSITLDTENKFQFAYTTTNTLNNAKLYYTDYSSGKMINLSVKRSDQCENGGKGCATVNRVSTETSSMEETEILSKLQPIDQLLSEVMVFHNLKSELPGYKDEYRKYLKSIENHERALNTLKDSDMCVLNFLSKHKGSGDAGKIWYGGLPPTEANDHSKRGGLSKSLIQEYEKYITDKILDTSDVDACKGFYSSCPDGYSLDTANPCPEDSSKFGCIVDTIPSDTAALAGIKDNKNAQYPLTTGSNDNDDTDSIVEGPKVDTIEKDNRMKAERSWRIGAKAVEDLTKQGILKFKPWKDQQNIQTEYLENKYRNIRTIIKTTDKALGSYRIATSISKAEALNQSEEPVEGLLQKVTSIKTPKEAVADGSAVAFACPELGFSTDGKKEVGTKYKERELVTDGCVGKDEDGNIYYYDCYKNVTKYGTIQLNCKALESATTGYVDIKYEQYVEDTKNDKKTITLKKKVDMRIKNDPTSYPSLLAKTPTNINSLVEIQTNGCSKPTTWNFTVNGLVKEFMPTILGGCKSGLDAQEKHLFNLAKGKGRIVAKDFLDKVIETRIVEEQKVKTQLEKDKNTIEELEKRRESAIASLEYWTCQAKQATYKKNDIQGLINESDERLKSIATEIKSIKEKQAIIEKQKGMYGKMAEDSAEMAKRKITMLEWEQDCIEKGEGFCVTLTDNDCEDIKTCKDKVSPTGVITTEQCSNANENCCAKASAVITLEEGQAKIEDIDAYISISKKSKGKEYLAKLDGDLERYNSSIENIQKRIKATEEQIEKKKIELAQNYVKLTEEAQNAIEDANDNYESFIEKDYRMEGPKLCSGGLFNKTCQKRWDDALTPTIVNILHRDGVAKNENQENSKVVDYVRKKIEETWFTDAGISKMRSTLSSLGIPDKINAAEVLDLGMDVTLSGGVHTLDDIVETLKDKIIELAAKKIQANIKKGDTIITEELEAAVEEVNQWSGSQLCLAGEGEAENSESCQNGGSIDLMAPENYGAGVITTGHNELIIKLRKPQNAGILSAAEIELGETFGIPEGIETREPDKEYFVALPARGIEKGSKKGGVCTYNTEDTRDSDGCDYMSPRAPLAVIPPLREVFYFSALDHDDIPSLGKQEVGEDEDVKNPSISHLLEQKYPEEGFEYLPEVWRYLLARPNLRKDGKYQQTFIERGYGQEDLGKYLKSFKDEEVNRSLARGGIYPCRVGSPVDVSDDKDIKKVSIAKGGSGASKCYELSTKGGYAQHLLADDNKKDGKNNPSLKAFGGKAKPIYTNQSELAQFLIPEKKNVKKLQYRPLLRSSFAYLKDVKANDKDSNNFTRQMAETTSFKRNVMGGFLENVNAEFQAKKTMNNAKEDVKKTLNTLCEQIHNSGNVVGNEESEEGEKKTKACIDAIMENTGLAQSSADNDYTSGDKTYYGALFSKLEGWKNAKLREAKDSLGTVEKDYGDKLDKVKERIKEIKDLIEAFEEGDPDEYAQIRPGANKSTATEDAKKAKAEREVALMAEEEAILSMDNQSRGVAYCPIY